MGYRDRHGQFNLIEVNEFNATVDGLTELELIGGWCTWSNGVGQNLTRNKIDQAFGNHQWTERWPQVKP